MLLKTGVELELLTDPTMYLFFEMGLRGGVSSIFKRYATSNCKQSDDFDERVDPRTLWYCGKF